MDSGLVMVESLEVDVLVAGVVAGGRGENPGSRDSFGLRLLTGFGDALWDDLALV